MAELGCTSGCSCHAEEDGFFANDSEHGRRNTVVTGNGTLSDPWTVSFIDSVQYRPVAAEIRYPDRSLDGIQTLNGEGITVVYKTSPNNKTVFVGYPTPTSPSMIVSGNYFIVGAAAEFQANADAGTKKAISIRAAHATLGFIIIAGAVTAGLTTEDMILTASGYSPGLFGDELVASGFGPRTQAFTVAIRETTAGALNIKKLKFWVAII
jgi:hypothetical protein